MKSKTIRLCSLLISVMLIVSVISSCKSKSPDAALTKSSDSTAQSSSSIVGTETKTQAQAETKREEALDSVHEEDNISYGSYYFTKEEIELNKDKPTKIFDLGVVIYGDIIVPPYIKNVGGINREYIMKTYQSRTCTKEEDTEYKCPPYEDYEKYKELTFNGCKYDRKGKTDRSEIGKRIGQAQLRFRMYCDDVQEYDETKTSNVYEIKNVSPEFAVAVKFKNGYYAYVIKSENFKCSTFGELAGKMNFYENIDLNYFAKFYMKKSVYETKYFYIKDDTELMNLFRECENAKVTVKEYYANTNAKVYVQFVVKSDIYEIYCGPNWSNEEIKIYDDGYMRVGSLYAQHTFFIGKDNAQKIIDYATNNGVRKDLPELCPKYYYIAGTVTELNNRRIVINDGILCKNKNDGMDFIYEFHSKEEAQGFIRNFKVGDNIEFSTNYKLSQNKIIKPGYVYKIKFNELEADFDVSNVAEESGL